MHLASTVLWALAFTVPGDHGENLPHASDINSIVGAYNHLVPDGVSNQTYQHTYSLSLSRL